MSGEMRASPVTLRGQGRLPRGARLPDQPGLAGLAVRCVPDVAGGRATAGGTREDRRHERAAAGDTEHLGQLPFRYVIVLASHKKAHACPGIVFAGQRDARDGYGLCLAGHQGQRCRDGKESEFLANSLDDIHFGSMVRWFQCNEGESQCDIDSVFRDMKCGGREGSNSQLLVEMYQLVIVLTIV